MTVVSPIPLYNLIGNKEALVDTIADPLPSHPAPPPRDDECWAELHTRYIIEGITRDVRTATRGRAR